MGTLLGLLFHVLVMSSLLVNSEGAVYSTPDIALKFSQCLIENISESPYFTDDDRDSMIEVADVMAKTMRYELPGIKTPIRALAIAFVTSMADVVILEDPAKNILRKDIYSEALEQCSISATGYIDSEFIIEALHIMTSFENSKAASFTKVKENSDSSYYSEEYYEPDPQVSDAYFDSDLPTSDDYVKPGIAASDKIVNLHSVRPSPVNIRINPAPANFNPIFRLPQSRPQFSAGSSISQANANIKLTVQPKSYTNIPSRFVNSGILQRGGNFGLASSSVITRGNISPVSDMSSRPIFTEFGGLNVPQMKESKVVAIPPLDNPPFGKISFQDKSVLKTNENPIQPSDVLNISPKQVKSFSMTSSASLPQTNVQRSDAFNNVLENVMYNILSNSSTFRDAFHFGIDQQRAMDLARIITEQSFQDHEGIAKEAINAVSEAISKVPLVTPIDYAHTIARSLSSILQHNNMTLFMDGVRTASDLLSNLPNKKHISQPMPPPDDKKVSDSSIYTEWEQEQPPFNSEMPTNTPEDVNGEIFGNILRQYLRESPEISKIFCTPEFSTDRIQIYFSIIRASLSEYKEEISTVAASIASGTLAELSQKELCSEYSQIISQEIAGILDENGLLNNANPEEIINRMEFSLKQIQNLKAQSQPPQTSYIVTNNSSSKDTGNSSVQMVPTLQPSFSSISNEYKEEVKVIPSLLNFSEIPDDYASSTIGELYTTSISDLSEVMEQHEKYVEETRQKPFTGLPIIASMSLMNEPVTESELKSDLNILTTALMNDVTDETSTSSSSLTDYITSISQSTDNTFNYPNYATEDYEEVAVFLLDELKSALTESTTELSSQESGKSLKEEEKFSKIDASPSEITIASSNQNTGNKDVLPQRKRRKIKRKTTVIQMDTTPATSIQADQCDEGDDTSPRRILTQSASSRRQAKHQVQTTGLPSGDFSQYFPVRILSKEADDSTVYQNNPVRSRNSRRQPEPSEYEVQDSYATDSPLSRKDLSVTDEYYDKVPFDTTQQKSSRRQSAYKVQEKNAFLEKSSFADTSTEHPPVQLEPSFKEPVFSDSLLPGNKNSKRTSSLSPNFNGSRNSSILLERSVSRIVASSINFIRSEDFDLYELCNRLNELAGVVNIPPLDYCNEIPMIDFLLHVLMSVTKSSKSV